MPTPRENVIIAMRNQDPGEIPVFCQMAIGHALLNTDVDPVAFNFTNEGFARALLALREKYDFDGILIHKPGRDDSAMKRATLQESDEGISLIYPDGGRILCTRDDDPKYYAPAGWSAGTLLPGDPEDALDELESFNFDDPFAGLPPSMIDWAIHKGLHFYDSFEQIPEFYYGTIDRLVAKVGECYSVHGEVKAPLDYLINLLGMQNAMMAMLTEPEQCHAILERATGPVCIWARAQLRRGCDAIKISSPYAGGGFISRELYERFVTPYERRVARAVHEEGGFVYTHTCGAIGDRLDLMAATEIDGIETLDPPPLGNTELAEAKAQFGERLFFKGNLDSVNVLLRGDEAKVRRVTRETLEVGAKGGGFILSTACSVAPAVPPANLQAMVDEVRKFSAERTGTCCDQKAEGKV